MKLGFNRSRLDVTYQDKKVERLEKEIEELKEQLEYFAINVIESHEMKKPVHPRTHQKAVEFLKNRNKA